MKVSWHNTICKYPHWYAFACVGYQVNECVIVAICTKDLIAGISTVDDVVANSSD